MDGRLREKGPQRDRVAVVTGGSSGLGLSLAGELLKESWQVVAVARDAARLAAAAARLGPAGERYHPMPADVSRAEEMAALASRVGERFAGVDFLIANAGVVGVDRVADMPWETLRQIVDIDLWGAMVTAKSFLPLLRPPGRILFVASGYGLMGAAGYAAYCAAKAGVLAFAESLRREVARQGISVYAACPPDLDTPQHAQELASMPPWMKQQLGARCRARPAQVAARRILRKCRGGRFLISVSSDVSILLLATRLLPRRVRDGLIDWLFPRP